MVVMKVAYFENLSTTTIIVPYASDFGREVMKFMVMLFVFILLRVLAPEILPVAFAPLVLAGTQDNYAHSTRCHLACVAKTISPRSAPLFVTAPDALIFVCRRFIR